MKRRATGPTLFDLERPAEAAAAKIERPYNLPGTGIHLGTSSFTSPGWAGSFYPAGMQNREYLSYYATQFDTVEIDSTFYGTPVAWTVSNWAQKTPADFVFAAKVPQTITHDKVLVNCEAEFDEFMERMNLLGAKLGPLVLQFPFFGRSVFRDANAFLARLRVFLKRARETTKARLVVEVRNRDWLNAPLTEILQEYDASLALVDLSHMPRPWEME